MDEYGANLITITDEDGVEYEMEILNRFEFEGREYLALTPAGADDEEESLEVNLLRITEVGGEEVLDVIDDEDELQAAYDALMELIFEEEEDEA